MNFSEPLMSASTFTSEATATLRSVLPNRSALTSRGCGRSQRACHVRTDRGLSNRHKANSLMGARVPHTTLPEVWHPRHNGTFQLISDGIVFPDSLKVGESIHL